jgi:hypothetical protein
LNRALRPKPGAAICKLLSAIGRRSAHAVHSLARS